MKNNTAFILAILIVLFSMVILLIGIKTEVTGEKLCVDGTGAKNLEGIMCEEETITFFGYNEEYSLLLLIPIILSLIFFIRYTNRRIEEK